MLTVQIPNTAMKVFTALTLTNVKMAYINVVQVQNVTIKTEITLVSVTMDFTVTVSIAKTTTSVSSQPITGRETAYIRVMKTQAVQTILALIHVNVILVSVEPALKTQQNMIGKETLNLSKDATILMNVWKGITIATREPNVTILMVVLLVLVWMVTLEMVPPV